MAFLDDSCSEQPQANTGRHGGLVVMSEHIDAARAVIDAARRYNKGRFEEDGIYSPAHLSTLISAVDALEAFLSAPPEDERTTWSHVLSGDEVLMKSGQWVKVVNRWTRPNYIEVCVLIPPTAAEIAAADEVPEPRRKTYPVQPDGKVTRRPGPDTYAVELLNAALGGYVIASREEGKW
jgi:hypothetical protein